MELTLGFAICGMIYRGCAGKTSQRHSMAPTQWEAEVTSVAVFLLRSLSWIMKEMEETGSIGHKCPILGSNLEATDQPMMF